MTEVGSDNRRRAEHFVRKVEAALGDLPPGERAELTAGLVDHLLEPGEDGRPLLDEQPEPREYAAELRTSVIEGSAAGTRTPQTAGKRRRSRATAWAAVALVILVAAVVALVRSVATPDEDPSVSPTASQSASPAAVAVPDVTGLTQEEAVQQLLAVGLALDSVSIPDALTVDGQAGFVAETSPAAGELVEPGTVVELIIPAQG